MAPVTASRLRPWAAAQSFVGATAHTGQNNFMAQANTLGDTEDFATLLDEMMGADTGFAGSVVTGRVIRIDDDVAVVDVGLKSEGRVPLKEFAPQGMKPEVKPGDMVELFIERYEDRDGAIVLSREKARREEAWTLLEKAAAAQVRVNGIIFGRVKGGFTVDSDNHRRWIECHRNMSH